MSTTEDHTTVYRPYPKNNENINHNTSPTKFCNTLSLLSYTLISIISILSLLNVLLKSTIYRSPKFWIFLSVGLLYPLLMMLFFLLIFAIYKAFKFLLIYLSAILNILLLLSIAVLIQIKLKTQLGFISVAPILLILAIIVTKNSLKDSLSRLLISISIDKLYHTKFKILKIFTVRIVKVSYAIYFGLFSLATNLMAFLESATAINSYQYKIDKYLLGTTITMGIFIFYTFIVILIFESFEPTLLGNLIFINNTKEKIKNNKITTNDINKCFKELKEKQILNSFLGLLFSSYEYPSNNKYKINFNEKVKIILKDNIEQLEKTGFPLSVFSCTAGFLYSLYYNVSLQDATNLCIPAFYHSGCIKLIDGYGLGFITGTNNVLVCMNMTGLVAVFWMFRIITAFETKASEWVMFGFTLGIVFISMFNIVSMLNSLLLGYLEALICLYIEDPETVLKNERYKIKLKKYMKRQCDTGIEKNKVY